MTVHVASCVNGSYLCVFFIFIDDTNDMAKQGKFVNSYFMDTFDTDFINIAKNSVCGNRKYI